MTARRAPQNPILTPADVPPSRRDFQVVGAFNPAVTRHDGDVVLLLRVAEGPRETASGDVAAAVFDPGTNRVEIRRWRRSDVGTNDPRVIEADGGTWLTSMSHLRVARSRGKDGLRFDVESAPALFPATPYESFGVEDARITRIDDIYWINYTAVSEHGIATALASTKDFRAFERHGIIFSPNNRDVTLFPEKIGGRFVALHRPMPHGLGHSAIWAATSADLHSWGDHRLVAARRAGAWDDAKIGGGAVPFRVTARGHEGWLAIYHGVTESPPTYSLGALLLDAREPWRVIARSREPILRPETEYERTGFYGHVVFTCGLLADGDRVRIYYGAADGVTAVADLSLEEILSGLSPT